MKSKFTCFKLHFNFYFTWVFHLRKFAYGIEVKNSIEINFIVAITNYMHYYYKELWMLLMRDILCK